MKEERKCYTCGQNRPIELEAIPMGLGNRFCMDCGQIAPCEHGGKCYYKTATGESIPFGYCKYYFVKKNNN